MQAKEKESVKFLRQSMFESELAHLRAGFDTVTAATQSTDVEAQLESSASTTATASNQPRSDGLGLAPVRLRLGVKTRSLPITSTDEKGALLRAREALLGGV